MTAYICPVCGGIAHHTAFCPGVEEVEDVALDEMEGTKKQPDEYPEIEFPRWIEQDAY